MADQKKNKNMKNKKGHNNAILKNAFYSNIENRTKNKKEKSNNYVIKKKIGEGSFGEVYLVYSKKTSMQCVLKKIDLKGLSKEEIKDTYNEVNLLKKLDHPNIIKFIEVYKSQKNLEIITEFAEKGDLYNQINLQMKKKAYFPEKTLIDWLVQICQALKYIHSKHIIHRDIKPQNIFLNKKGSIKLGDFGVSKTLNNTLEKARTFVGTTYYLPPELINGKKYSYMADIWSLGVTFYQLMTFKMPFDGKSLPSIMKKIVSGEGYEKISKKYFSEDLINLVYKMMDSKPNHRPNANDILNMDFIKKRIEVYLKENQYDDVLSQTIIKRYQDNYGNNLKNENDSNNSNNGSGEEIHSFKNKLKFNEIIGVKKNVNINTNKNDDKNNDETKQTKQKAFLGQILLNKENNDSKITSISDNKNKEKDKNEEKKPPLIDVSKIKIKIISPLKNEKNEKDKKNKKENETKKKVEEINYDSTVKSNMASYNVEEEEKYGFESKFFENNAISFENGEKEINLDNQNQEVFFDTNKEIEKRQKLRDEYDYQRNMSLMKSIIIGKSDNEVENENKLINHNESEIEEDEKENEEDNSDDTH